MVIDCLFMTYTISLSAEKLTKGRIDNIRRKLDNFCQVNVRMTGRKTKKTSLSYCKEAAKKLLFQKIRCCCVLLVPI